MSAEISSAAIATIVSVIVSIIIALFSNRFNNKRYISEQVDSLNKLIMEYPFLEDKEFIDNWNNDRLKIDKEKVERYDAYCTILFNLLFRISRIYNFRRNSIRKIIAIFSWLKFHEGYWKENKASYNIIESRITHPGKRYVKMMDIIMHEEY
jgi:hypothetical protein